MSGNKYLFDTNVFIALIEGNPSVNPFLQKRWFYSFITRMELLSKLGLTDAESRKVEQILNLATLVPYNENIELTATSLRRLYGTKLPDAIIASSALEMSLPLVTFDKGFRKITPLNIVLLEH